MVLRLLGLGLWLFLGVVGAWLLFTGRRIIFGLPKGLKEGLPLRLFGLVYLAAAVWLTYRLVQGSFAPESIVFAYVSLGIVVLVAAFGYRRKARASAAAGPRS